MLERLAKLDRTVYRIERIVVVAALVVMATVVSIDVIHRTFADPDSKIADWLVKVIRFCGPDLAPGGTGEAAVLAWAPYGTALAFVWLVYIGFRTAKHSRALSPGRALIYAAATVGLMYGMLQLLIFLVPNGFVWSQPLALVLTLWVGMFGASMCTYENKHLKVEAVQRFLPPRIRPMLGVVSSILTAAFCSFLAWASADYVSYHYVEWADTEHRGGLFLGVDIPRWLGFSALPIAFTIMALRFFAAAVAMRGEDRRRDSISEMVGAALAGERPSRLSPKVEP